MSSGSVASDDGSENRVREIQREIQFLKAELKDSEARYATWKNVLAEECKDNESHFQAKLNASHTKFASMADELKESVSVCRKETKQARAHTERIIEDQNDQIENAMNAQSVKIDSLKEEFSRGIKEQSRKFSKENASIAQAFLTRMDEQRQTTEGNIQECQAIWKKQLEDQKAQTKMHFMSELRNQQTILSSSFADDLAMQKASLEGSFEGSLALMKDSLTQLFRDEIAKQRKETEENFLRGIDNMERWLKSENSRRDAEMNQIREQLVEQAREAKAAEERRLEAKRQMHELVASESNRVEGLMEKERERISSLMETVEERFRESKAVATEMKEETLIKTSKMVKECLMLNVQLKSLEDRCTKHMAVYETALEECSRTKEDMQQSFDNQTAVFQSYEDKILQHSSDFQAYLDEHSSKTEDMQSRVQDLADDLDRLHDKVLDQEGMIEATNASLNRVNEDRLADSAYVGKMGKTWESLYAHLAAQLQDTIENHESSLAQQEEMQNAREVSLKNAVEELEIKLEVVKADTSENRSLSLGLRAEIEDAEMKFKTLNESLGDFDQGKFSSLSEMVSSQAKLISEVQELQKETKDGVDQLSAETLQNVEDLMTLVKERTTKDEFLQGLNTKAKEIFTEIDGVRSAIAEQSLRTERVEASRGLTDNELQAVKESIHRLSQNIIGSLSRKVDSNVDQLATFSQKVASEQKELRDLFDFLGRRVNEVSADVQQRPLQTTVAKKLASLEENLSAQVDKVNQVAEKNRGRAERLREDVDKCVIKVDVLQGNLGSININLFNDLQKRVSEQTKQLLLDKQERSFAHSKIMEIENTIDVRINEFLTGEEYTATQDEIRGLIESTERKLSRDVAVLKREVETVAEDATTANNRADEFDRTLADLSETAEKNSSLLLDINTRFNVESESTERQLQEVDAEMIALASRIEEKTQDVLKKLENELSLLASCDFVGEAVGAFEANIEGTMNVFKDQLHQCRDFIKQIEVGILSTNKDIEGLKENLSTVDKEFGVLLSSQVESRRDIQNVTKCQVEAQKDVGGFVKSYELQLKELREVIEAVGTELMGEVTKHVLVQNQNIANESNAMKEHASTLNNDINGQLEAIKEQVKGCFRACETKMHEALDAHEADVEAKINEIADKSNGQIDQMLLLQDDVEMITTNVADIQATIEPAVATLSAKVDDQNRDIQAARDEISEVNATVDEISSRVIVLEDKSRTFTERAMAIDSKIAGQNDEYRTKCEAMEESLKEYLDRGIEMVLGTVSEKASQTSDALEILKTNVDVSLDLTNRAVAEVNTSFAETADGINQKLKEHETAITALDSAIKATASRHQGYDEHFCQIDENIASLVENQDRTMKDIVAKKEEVMEEIKKRMEAVEAADRTMQEDIDEKIGKCTDKSVDMIHDLSKNIEEKISGFEERIEAQGLSAENTSSKVSLIDSTVNSMQRFLRQSLESTNGAVSEVKESLMHVSTELHQKLIDHDTAIFGLREKSEVDVAARGLAEDKFSEFERATAAIMEKQTRAEDDILAIKESVINELTQRINSVEENGCELKENLILRVDKCAEQSEQRLLDVSKEIGAKLVEINERVEAHGVNANDSSSKIVHLEETIGAMQGTLETTLQTTNNAVVQVNDSLAEVTTSLHLKLSEHDTAIADINQSVESTCARRETVEAFFRKVEEDSVEITKKLSQTEIEIARVKEDIVAQFNDRMNAVDETSMSMKEYFNGKIQECTTHAEQDLQVLSKDFDVKFSAVEKHLGEKTADFEESSAKLLHLESAVDLVQQSMETSFSSTNKEVDQVKTMLAVAGDEFNKKFADILVRQAKKETEIKPLRERIDSLEQKTIALEKQADTQIQVVEESNIALKEFVNVKIAACAEQSGKDIQNAKSDFDIKFGEVERKLGSNAANSEETSVEVLNLRSTVNLIQRSFETSLQSTNSVVSQVTETLTEAKDELHNMFAARDAALSGMQAMMDTSFAKRDFVDAHFAEVEAGILLKHAETEKCIAVIKDQELPSIKELARSVEQKNAALEKLVETKIDASDENFQERLLNLSKEVDVKLRAVREQLEEYRIHAEESSAKALFMASTMDSVQRNVDNTLSSTSDAVSRVSGTFSEINEEFQRRLMEQEAAIASLKYAVKSTVATREDVEGCFQMFDETTKEIVKKHTQAEGRIDEVLATISVVKEIQSKLLSLEGSTKQLSSEEQHMLNNSSEKIPLLESAVATLQKTLSSLESAQEATSKIHTKIDLKLSEHDSNIKELARSVENCRTNQDAFTIRMDVLGDAAREADAKQLHAAKGLKDLMNSQRAQQNVLIGVEAKQVVMEKSLSNMQTSTSDRIEENFRKNKADLENELKTMSSTVNQRLSLVEDFVKETEPTLEDFRKHAADLENEVKTLTTAVDQRLCSVEEFAKATEPTIEDFRKHTEDLENDVKTLCATVDQRFCSVEEFAKETEPKFETIVCQVSTQSQEMAALKERVEDFEQGNNDCQREIIVECADVTQSTDGVESLRKSVADVEEKLEKSLRTTGQEISMTRSMITSATESLESKIAELGEQTEKKTSALNENLYSYVAERCEELQKVVKKAESRSTVEAATLKKSIGFDLENAQDAFARQLATLQEQAYVGGALATRVDDLVRKESDALTQFQKSLESVTAVVSEKIDSAEQNLKKECSVLDMKIDSLHAKNLSDIDSVREQLTLNIEASTKLNKEVDALESQIIDGSKSIASTENKIEEMSTTFSQRFQTLEEAIKDESANTSKLDETTTSRFSVLEDRVQTLDTQTAGTMESLRERFFALQSETTSALGGLRQVVDSTTTAMHAGEKNVDADAIIMLEKKMIDHHNVLDQRIGVLGAEIRDQSANLQSMIDEGDKRVASTEEKMEEQRIVFSHRFEGLEKAVKDEAANLSKLTQTADSRFSELEERVQTVDTQAADATASLKERLYSLQSESVSSIDGIRHVVDCNATATKELQAKMETVESLAANESNLVVALDNKLVEQRSLIETRFEAVDATIQDQSSTLNMMQQAIESKTAALSEKVGIIDIQTCDNSGRIASLQSSTTAGLEEVRCLTDSSLNMALGVQEQIKKLRVTNSEETRKLSFLVNDLGERTKLRMDSVNTRVGQIEQCLQRSADVRNYDIGQMQSRPAAIADTADATRSLMFWEETAVSVDKRETEVDTRHDVVGEPTVMNEGKDVMNESKDVADRDDEQPEMVAEEIEIIASCSNVGVDDDDDENSSRIKNKSSFTISIGGPTNNQSVDEMENVSEEADNKHSSSLLTVQTGPELSVEKTKKKVTIKTPTHNKSSSKKQRSAVAKARRGNLRNALKALCDDIKSDVMPHLSEERDTAETNTSTHEEEAREC